ncbi:hypothetical protein BJ875DRAFT_288262 [Amylocarpus encephaloides]|uniref:Uncharacterized protein n=1 Tax=Amylocarpus encephaloides TaxID=45428 RepID=A0A9P7YK42_9HELO|nr:hypothetical protein BJ875DRAFT_288262 [Amylocarpus encephaloides]
MKKTLNGYFVTVYTAWLESAVSCCSSQHQQHQSHEKCSQPPTRDVERHMRIEHHQPHLVPPPVPEPQERPTTRGREWVDKTRTYAVRASSRGSFSVKRRLNAYNGPRRPRIGAPTDFRHVDKAMPSRPTGGFRPLELSIYTEQQPLPMLPHFGTMEEIARPDYPASVVTHSRSESSLSFRIPRKPVRASSRASSEWTAQFQPRPESLSASDLLARLETELPTAPPPARLRAMTEPPAYDRIKSALHEKFELEQRLKDIDEVIEERKSIYFNSRPTSRATSRPRSIYSESQEPMPSSPALRPSFATRVAASTRTSNPTIKTVIQRPQTAPSKPAVSRIQTTSIPNQTSSIPTPPPKSPLRPQATPLPPPLPLILVQPKQASHPPLRKKKSFSRVSNWLFPSASSDANSHSRVSSLDSVTNTPKPVTSREGFYQCVDIPHNNSPCPYNGRRASVSTVSTLSTITTAPSEEFGHKDGHLTITPNSSPGRSKRVNLDGVEKELQRERRGEEKSIELERMRTFGEEQKWRGEMNVARNSSVGVAF